jgi:hypothetical protein
VTVRTGPAYGFKSAAFEFAIGVVGTSVLLRFLVLPLTLHLLSVGGEIGQGIVAAVGVVEFLIPGAFLFHTFGSLVSSSPILPVSHSQNSCNTSMVADKVVDTLARLLPAAERSRFVAEAQGNLGDCERWWQRLDHLVRMMFGTPRLAWMMWRDGRRGRV